MIKVFITCAGGGIAQSVIDSLRQSNRDYYIITNDLSGPNYGFLGADKLVELPRIDSDIYVEHLLKKCIELAVDLIIPGSDLELFLLSKSKEIFKSAGIKVLVSDAEFIAICRDKLTWSKTLSGRTKTVVPSFTVEELRLTDSLESIVELPAIAKPRGGSSSSLLKIIKDKNDLVGLDDNHIVQPFLFPDKNDSGYDVLKRSVENNQNTQIQEVSVQLLFDKNGVLVEKFASINKLKNGVPVEIVPIDDMRVWVAVDELLDSLSMYKIYGPVNVQGRITDKGLVFFEMNPRFTGITGNRALFGFNEVDYLVSNFLDLADKKLFINYSKIGVRQVACGSKNFDRDNKTITVSGANGWLGSNLVKAIDNDSSVRKINALVRKESYETSVKNFSSYPKVTVLVVDESNIEGIFGETDCFINTASARPPHGDEAILESYEYQSKLLTTAVKLGVDRIVNTSSQSVYDSNSSSNWNECSNLSISNSYGLLKYTLEKQLKSLSEQNQSVTAVSLRLGRLIGGYEGARESEFFHKVIKFRLEGNEIKISNGDTVNNLLDLSDAIKSVFYFMNNRTKRYKGDAINICSFSMTTNEYVWAVNDALDMKGDVNFNKAFMEKSEAAKNGVLETDLAKELGWKPCISLYDSVNNIINFFKP